MDVAVTGDSPNRDKITDYGGWDRVNIKDRYISSSTVHLRPKSHALVAKIF